MHWINIDDDMPMFILALVIALGFFMPGCAAESTVDPYSIADAGMDAGECERVSWVDGYWFCDQCKCPGQTCSYGELTDAEPINVVTGICGENLECSAACPSEFLNP